MTRILIIEDDDQTGENLEVILQMEGFDVLRATNGQAGLDLALKNTPSLIICDVGMPKLDGLGVLQVIRSNPSTVDMPFIFLTARAERHDQRTGMNLGADDYLCKPVDAEDLLAAIHTRLQRQKQTQEVALRDAKVSADFSSAKPLEALDLTPREADVLLWVAQGKANSDIATILGMSEKTVKIHLNHIFEKLNVETRTAAARMAIELLISAKPPETVV